MDPFDHLFRRESGRMISTVARIFGVQNLALAEDVVQDAFCRAVEVWKYKGWPEHPEAWLMATAKNRALDALRRERTATRFAPELASEWSLAWTMDESFQPYAIKDDHLRMMFSCCDPRLAEEAQIGLILNLVCGFSVDEIASAFLKSHAAIEKRIGRAKRHLAKTELPFDLADADVANRLGSVQRALYLLFNEGYHGANPESAVRTDLCRESMRLVTMILDHPAGNVPSSFALAALMCFNAARLSTRLDSAGDLVPLFDQDRSRWDQHLIGHGKELLEKSAIGSELTTFHLEAMIACLHAEAPSLEDTAWAAVVELYDALQMVQPSPVVALNRAIAFSRLHGPKRGLAEIAGIEGLERLEEYPFCWAAIGELELQLGEAGKARSDFERAAQLARSPMERRFFERKAQAARDSVRTQPATCCL